MKKILSKFGYVPKSDSDNLRTNIAGLLAVNAELRENLANLEREVRQVISERERHKLAHDTLKEEHDKQQRAAAITAKALSGLAPTMMGIRK